jgi:hypothetical protein
MISPYSYGVAGDALPEGPREVLLRPLSKGMRRDIPMNSLEIGEFFDLKNLQGKMSGLSRREALSAFRPSCFTPTNWMDRGDCESTTPAVKGTVAGAPNGCTYALSTTQKHGGANSFKHTKSGAPSSWQVLLPVLSTSMYSLMPGHTYTLSCWLYVPSVSGPTPSEAVMTFRYYNGALVTASAPGNDSLLDQWQFLTLTVAIPSDATYVDIYHALIAAATAGEFIYWDDVSLYDTTINTLNPFIAMESVWDIEGLQTTVLFDTRLCYFVTTVLTLISWSYAAGTVTGTIVGGVTRLTGAGVASWTAVTDIRVGDVFFSGYRYGIVKSVNSATEIDLETAIGTFAAGSTYEIRRSVLPDPTYFMDSVVVEGKLLICDGKREVRAYDPIADLDTYGYFSADATYDLFPKCVCFFKDRLFFGNTVETGGTEFNFQRIRWTTVLSFGVLPALQFVDIPYSAGFLRRLVGLENYLVAYFSDCIYIGRPTNFGDTLPVAFDVKLNTGGNGLVGDRAICQAQGGHFMVLNDNIYYMGMDTVLHPIGDPIKELFFTSPSDLWSVRVVADVNNSRILFTAPSSTVEFSRIYIFDYISKAWSYEDVSGSFLSSNVFGTVYTYDTWLSSVPYTYDTGLGVFPSYADMGTVNLPALYVGGSEEIFKYENLTADYGTDAIPVVVESGDFDYGDADNERIHLRLSVRFRNVIEEDASFVVEVSNDSGETWKNVTLGRTLFIAAGERENYVNFRAKGSIFRFRISSSSSCKKYIIQEISLKAYGAGIESHLASNR